MIRSYWIDDDGSGTTGTVITNAELQKIYDNVEASVESPVYPSVSAADAIELTVATADFHFGGDASIYRSNTTNLAGATYETLLPGTGIWRVDPSTLTGSWRLQCVCRTQSIPTGGHVGYVYIVNLTDAPNTAMAAVSTASTQGTLIESSTIAWGVGGSLKSFGLKSYITEAGNAINVPWARIYRVP